MDRKRTILFGNSFCANRDEICVCVILWSFLLKEKENCHSEMSLGHIEDAEQASHLPPFILSFSCYLEKLSDLPEATFSKQRSSIKPLLRI